MLNRQKAELHALIEAHKKQQLEYMGLHEGLNDIFQFFQYLFVFCQINYLIFVLGKSKSQSREDNMNANN